MENVQHGKIIDEICEYAEKYEIKAMLQEYMKRLVLEQPADPVQFLIKTISENPFDTKCEQPSAETDSGR